MSSYVLTLYVAGRTDRSARSIAAIRQLCDEHLGDDCELRVIDVLEDPAAAEAAKILATPTLVRAQPPPQRSVVGELVDLARVASLLGLPRPDNGRSAPPDGGSQ